MDRKAEKKHKVEKQGKNFVSLDTTLAGELSYK